MREGLATLEPKYGYQFLSFERLAEEREQRDHLADYLNAEEERLVEAGMEMERIAL